MSMIQPITVFVYKLNLNYNTHLDSITDIDMIAYDCKCLAWRRQIKFLPMQCSLVHRHACAHMRLNTARI